MFSNIFGTKKKTEYSGPVKNEAINQMVMELKNQPKFAKVELTKEHDVIFCLQESENIVFIIEFTLSGFQKVNILNGITDKLVDSFHYRGDRKDPVRVIGFLLNQALDYIENDQTYTNVPDYEGIEALHAVIDLYPYS